MSIKSRLLMVVAALMLVSVYYVPIWSITLVAPQYPDGLGMYISVNDITGHDRHDLQNINILNHYVGMKPIDPAEVPELELMPWLFAGLIITGLAVAAIGKPGLILAWIAVFVISSIAGLADFYLWGYDYGHNLNPKAAIKIPGESYQPPLFGTKQMLNIKASSWPYWGSLFIGLSLFTGAAAGWLEYKPKKKMKMKRPLSKTSALVIILFWASWGCTDEGSIRSDAAIKTVAKEKQTCDFCRQEIRSSRYGGIVSDKHENNLRFRSIECLAGFVINQGTEKGQIRVINFIDAKTLLTVDEAIYLQSPNLGSPNGMNFAALDRKNVDMLEKIERAYPGEFIEWNEIVERVAQSGYALSR